MRQTLAYSLGLVALSALVLGLAPDAHAATALGLALATGVPAVPAEFKAKLDKLSENLKTLVTDLQPRIKALEENGEGAAELKEEANKMVEENAKLHDEIKSMTERIDGVETAAKAGGLRGAASGVGHTIEDGFKSINSETRDKVEVEFSAKGYLGAKAVTDVGGSGGPLLTDDYLPGIQAPGQRRLTIRDLIMGGTTSKGSITYMKELAVVGAPDYQLTQGARKAEVDFTFEQVTDQVATVAEFVKIARQMMDDVPALRSYIQGRMRFLVEQKLEDEILSGTGVGNRIHGVNPQADAFDPTLDGTLGLPASGAHVLDVLGVAAYQVSLSHFQADGFVINPREGWRLRFLKDTQGRYLFSSPDTGSPNLRPWGIPAVESFGQPVDTFTAGAWMAAAQLFMRENVTARLSTENEDDFVRNLVTLLVELRAALAVYRPSSFVSGTFTAAAAA